MQNLNLMNYPDSTTAYSIGVLPIDLEIFFPTKNEVADINNPDLFLNPFLSVNNYKYYIDHLHSFVFSRLGTNLAISTPGISETPKTSVFTHDILQVSNRINVISRRSDNWDEEGSASPKRHVLKHAKNLIYRWIYEIYLAGYEWSMPYICSGMLGDITLEWYEENKQLHISIFDEKIEYIKHIRRDGKSQLKKGVLDINNNYIDMWRWLFNA